jgi:predicted transcriptional regulator
MKDIHIQIQDFLNKEASPASSRRVAQQLNIAQTKISRELNKLVKAGIAKVQLRREFDYEFCRKTSRNIACIRRRNYYWIEPSIPKKKRKAKIV